MVVVLAIRCSVMSESLQPHGLYVAPQLPLFMGFSRQEYWSRVPFPSLGDLPLEDLVKAVNFVSIKTGGGGKTRHYSNCRKRVKGHKIRENLKYNFPKFNSERCKTSPIRILVLFFFFNWMIRKKMIIVKLNRTFIPEWRFSYSFWNQTDAYRESLTAIVAISAAFSFFVKHSREA